MRLGFVVVALVCGIPNLLCAQNRLYSSANDDSYESSSSSFQELTATSATNRQTLDSPLQPIMAYCRPAAAWFNAEYLLWFIKGQSAPPLIQTFADSLANSGTLPAGTVTTLYPGSDNINYRITNGVRLSGGFWLTNEPFIGLDASIFFLDQNSNGASFQSTGSPVLARFYNNANSGTPTTLTIANPNLSTGYSGSINAVSTISSLYSGDMNIRINGYSLLADNTDYLGGMRYFDFRERLDIVSQSNFRDGTRLSVSDHFATSNQFYGTQIGVNSRFCGYRGFSIDGTVKLAIGGIQQRANVSGSNTVVSPTGNSDTEARGLYAQPSNIGNYSRTVFGFVPEVTFNLNYNFTVRSAVFLGYNFMWLNNISRPGDVIDPTVNDASLRYVANQTPGNANRPLFAFRDESFWMQGINIGIRVQY